MVVLLQWTVNGYLRIGFFSVKDIPANTELTFDYKFQRYGYDWPSLDTCC
jgi:histone-lysine N-methyltransferase SETD2